MISPQTAESLERAILGAILLDPAILHELQDLTTLDFASERNRLIYAAMLELAEDREPIDTLSIQARLGESQYAAIGGMAYLCALDLDLPDITATPMVARALRAHAAAARTVEASATFARKLSRGTGLHGDSGAGELSAAIDRHIAELENLRAELPSGARSFVATEHSAQDGILDLAGRRPQAMLGIPSLDRAGHLTVGTLTVIAGRPGEGKSALGLQAVGFSAINRSWTAAYLSLEMSTTELLERMIASRARVDYEVVRSRGFNPEQRRASLYALAEIRRAPIHIDDKPGRSLGEFARDVRRLKRDHSDLRLCVVDQLSLMPHPGEARERSDRRIGMLCTGMVRIARELDIAIALLTQLNRGPQREERFPTLADLANSDEIGQHAHAVLAIHRPATEDEPGTPGRMGAIGVLKHRGGRLFRVPVEFRGEYQTFVEVDDSRDPEPQAALLH